MANKVNPKIEDMQAAFKTLLQANFGNQFMDKPDSEVFKKLISHSVCEERHPDVLMCEAPVHYDEYNQTGQRIAAKDVTMRQYLSAFAKKVGDHFVAEESRRQADQKYPKEYYNFIAHHTELRRYKRFFDTLITIADRGHLPESTRQDEIPDILRSGLELIQKQAQELKKRSALIAERVERNLEEETIRDIASDYYLYLKSIEDKDVPKWISKDLMWKIRQEEEGFIFVEDQLMKIVAKYFNITAQNLESTYNEKMKPAQQLENEAEIYLALAASVRQTMKSLGIEPKLRDNLGKSR